MKKNGVMIFSGYFDLYARKAGGFENYGVVRFIQNLYNTGYSGFPMVTGIIKNYGTFSIGFGAGSYCDFNYSLQNPSPGFFNQGFFEVTDGGKCVSNDSSSFPVYTQTSGETRINGEFAAKNLNIQGGVLTGTGILSLTGASSNVGRGAVLSPGVANGSFGIFTINNDLNLLGSLDIDVGGIKTGRLDELVVNGELSLGADSVLNVTLRNGLIPQKSDEFEIVRATTINGVFSKLQLPTLPDGQSWDVSYLNNSVRLRLVAQ